MEHVFVADTNLFFECKRLEDLPWHDLDGDPVVVVLTKPVLAEIDKHKKGGGRTRRRALEIFTRIRAMLNDDVSEIIVREQGPRTILRVVPVAKPDPVLADVLDYTVNDDRIIGIAATLAGEPDVRVSVLTDDAGAAMTARTAGVGFQLIDPSWKRPPEASTEAKRIAALEKDLATYRAQEPEIMVRDLTTDPTEVVRRVACPLPTEEMDRLMVMLEERHPRATEFGVTDRREEADGSVVKSTPPDDEAIVAYGSKYDAWLARCRELLVSFHEGRDRREDTVTVTFGVSNRGTRPASRMRIEFEGLGGIYILRRWHDEDSDDEDVIEPHDAIVTPVSSFPAPPKPPTPKVTVQRPSRETARSVGKPGDVVASVLGRNSGLTAHLKAMEAIRSPLGDLGATSRLLKHTEPYRHLTSFGIASHLKSDGVLEHIGKPHARVQPIAERFPTFPARPRPRDPEEFYASEWPTAEPVQSGAYTCELFRHARRNEAFEIEVVFSEEGDAKGSVRCTVHAENLTKPVEWHIAVSRRVEEIDLIDIAERLIAACGD